MRKTKVVDPTYAKSTEYQKVISEIANAEHCPFCPEHFLYHKKPILNESGNWLITESSWPYTNAASHFLIIGKTHKEHFSELSLEDFAAVKELATWAIDTYHILGGGLTLRFGATEFTGATVCHLHFHLLSPELDPQTNRGKTITFPIG